MKNKNNPKARGTDIVVQELKDEIILYDLIIDQAYCLNQTSALVWNLCDGNSSVSDITKQLSNQLKQPVTDDLVWLAVDGLKKDNLLSNSEDLAIKFDGLSRREVIRKVGFASMIALPVISSLIAPSAVHAASGALPCGTQCRSRDTCTNGGCTRCLGVGGYCSTNESTACSDFGGPCLPQGTCDCFDDGSGTLICSCRGVSGGGPGCSSQGATCFGDPGICNGIGFGTCQA